MNNLDYQRLRQPSRPERSLGRTNLALIAGVTAVAGLTAMATNSLIKDMDSETEKGPKTTQLETVGTTIAIPDEAGEGIQSLVEEEAEASGVTIDWDTTQRLIDKARELNVGEPRQGEGYALPDIPNAPTTTVVSPTSAP